jgi:D-beta-D-heptose 7-phosphate kinase/D-beta-D-heptose 1-phosphate adenosyltransferase
MEEFTSIDNFSSSRVLVIGDVMLDRYWFGKVTRISPEAPVPIVKIIKTEDKPGGAANVALNIAVLGGDVILMGIVGSDHPAKTLKQKIIAVGVKPLLIESGEESTIIKLRVISQNQQLIRLDFEDGDSFTNQLVLLKQFERNLQFCDIVVMSDYSKGTLRGIHQSIIKLTRSAGKEILVDPKSDDFSCYAGANLITPNLHEFERVVGPCANEQKLIQKGKQLLKDYKIDNLLVTRGKKGMTLIREDKPEIHLPARQKEVFDVTGAGDTVMATLAVSLASRLSIEDSVSFGNIAAGIVVSKIGTSSVSLLELKLEVESLRHFNSGIVTLEQLLNLTRQAKLNGEKIVFTNGCFDILHAGHISYLQEAKKLGDRLIVAVNDDKSVERLKGKGRPINRIENRIRMLSSLKFVDWVFPFSEDTPESVIYKIIPDVLVKGGDYKPNEIAGYNCVTNSGGKVLVIDFKENISTTNMIKNIIKNHNNKSNNFPV